ncbi:MAG: toll/interleukin-1 receptor domain-containing protein [Alloacidobacterium sp.]
MYICTICCSLGRFVLHSIFVNYRRNDSEGEAGRLFDDLTAHFSHDCVFMDVAAIEPGRDFRKAIDQSVESCSVLLALIGRDWLDSKDALGQRRLDNANDFVRIELASALRRDIPVIPVLVRGAKMPLADQLPDDLKELHYRNAVELTHARWKSDVRLLIQALRPYLDAPAPREPVAAMDSSVTSRHSSLPPASPVAASTTTVMEKFETKTIERICKELAAYIGPISEV